MTSSGWAGARAPRRILPAVVLGGVLLTTGCTQRATVLMSNRVPARAVSAPRRSARNVYAEAGAGGLRPPAAGAPARVYVPNSGSGTVTVIDPTTFRVVDTFPVGDAPQHVVPSFDLRRLWVNNNGAGSLTPIDPLTGRPGRPLAVDDPYNLYFTPDGTNAIVVAESRQRIDFRDPATMALRSSLPVPCKGVNHLDFSADGSYFIASCEFANSLIKIDTATHRILGTLQLPRSGGMPQDVRLASDGTVFYVADMGADGVYVLDGEHLAVAGFVPTGVGAHGLYPSRDGTRFYVTNRGANKPEGKAHGPGSISVLDVATRRVVATWPVPGGGSPDMGNVSVDGGQLWVSGRYDREVYVFGTGSGDLLARIRVGKEPHGLTIWPQPGRVSHGHTGNMR
jgi:YVTN family beta-propeller protein